MLYCHRCNRKIHNSIKCKVCGAAICSEICVQKHFKLYHPSQPVESSPAKKKPGIFQICAGCLVWVVVLIACAGIFSSLPKQEQSTKPIEKVGQVTAEKGAVGQITAEKGAARAIRRAKAEAEAEAKNEANRKAYGAEVERLKAAYQKRLEKYEADREAYEKALPIYQAAKAEYLAAQKMVKARGFYDASMRDGASKLLLEFAQRDFRVIINLYPGTQAAKDAKILLDGGTMAARELPDEPDPVFQPREPRLNLPPPPQPVAVDYPPEPEEIAAAEAEAARKTEEMRRQTNEPTEGSPGFGANAGKVFVRGHMQNGRWVEGYYRNPPGAGSSKTTPPTTGKGKKGR